MNARFDACFRLSTRRRGPWDEKAQINSLGRSGANATHGHGVCADFDENLQQRLNVGTLEFDARTRAMDRGFATYTGISKRRGRGWEADSRATPNRGTGRRSRRPFPPPLPAANHESASRRRRVPRLHRNTFTMDLASHDIIELRDEFWTAARSRAEAYAPAKAALDYAIATTLLLLTAPIALLAMALVRLTSDGPALYHQRRAGLHGRVFTIHKIRTMYRDSEGGVARWCLPGDPRVTPVGRFLRWSHIDELPQLINVLRGEMSLIGPRPERPELIDELERAIPSYRTRMLVRPGLTGLAQIQLPPDVDLNSVRRKLACDFEYMNSMSLQLDLRILAGTALECLGVPGERIGRLLRLPNGRDRIAIQPVDPERDIPPAPKTATSLLG